MDVLTQEQRQRNMALIKSKNTTPEKTARAILRKFGYKFRQNDSSLIGKPDIVLRKAKKVIFIHGCFWHMHRCRFGRVVPKTNRIFWKNKRLKNVVRDRKVVRTLKKENWRVLVLWECQLRKIEKPQKILQNFINQE